VLLRLKVITGAKTEKIIELFDEDFELKIKLQIPAEKGKANKRIVELLAKRYNTSKSNIVILKGHKSNKKLIEIKDT